MVVTCFRTCFRTAICLVTLLLCATPVLPQTHGLPAEALPEPLKTTEAPILDELRFTGLRGISTCNLQTRNFDFSHAGTPFSLQSGVFGLPAALAETDRKTLGGKKACLAHGKTGGSGGIAANCPGDSVKSERHGPSGRERPNHA